MDIKSELLKKYFGYNDFKEGQSDIIDCLLSGRGRRWHNAHRRGKINMLSDTGFDVSRDDRNHIPAYIADEGSG